MKPIPARFMMQSASLVVPASVDKWGNKTSTTYMLKRVHIQPSSEVRKTNNNTDIALKSMMFVDTKTSTPKLDWMVLQKTALETGKELQVIANCMTYTVKTIDMLSIDGVHVHHYEVGLV